MVRFWTADRRIQGAFLAIEKSLTHGKQSRQAPRSTPEITERPSQGTSSWRSRQVLESAAALVR